MDCRIVEETESLVRIEGELTVYHVARLRDELLPLVRDRAGLSLDLGDLTVLDTAGLQLLLALKQEVRRQDRELAFRRHSPAVLKALDLFGLAGFCADPLELSAEESALFPFAYGTGSHPEYTPGRAAITKR